jgi:hypothetical protein
MMMCRVSTFDFGGHAVIKILTVKYIMMAKNLGFAAPPPSKVERIQRANHIQSCALFIAGHYTCTLLVYTFDSDRQMHLHGCCGA